MKLKKIQKLIMPLLAMFHIALLPYSTVVARYTGCETIATAGPVKGIVMGGNQQPLSGATVSIKGRKEAVRTDEGGTFTIEAAEGNLLEIAYVGYASHRQIVTAENFAGPLTITLQANANALDEVIIGSNVVSTKRKAEVAAITVLDNKTIRNSPYLTADQLLRGMVPGSNSVDMGPDNASIYMSIRGATAVSGQGNIKIYIDGIEVAYNSSYFASLDKDMIDHIEILRGTGGSTLYGSGASGGVIQVFTKKGQQDRSRLMLIAAAGPIESKYTKGNSQFIGTVNYNGGTPNASYYIGSQYRKITDFIPDASENFISLSGGSKVTLKKLSLDFSMQYSNRMVADATNPIVTELYNSGKYPSQSNTDKRKDQVGNLLLGTNINYSVFDWWNQQLIIGIDKQMNAFWSTVKMSTGLYAYGNYDYTTPSLRYSSSFVLPAMGLFRSKLTAGFEYARPEQTGTAGSSTESKGLGTFSSVSLNHETRDNYGYYLQYQPQLGEFLFLTAGLRVEKNDLFGSDFGWNGKAVVPRVGMTGNFNIASVSFKPRVSYGKGITAPTFLQRYGRVLTTSNYHPNPSLAPTSQKGIDYGLEMFALGNKLHVEVSYYDQMVQDLIISKNLGVENNITQYQYINLQSVKNTGWEFEVGGQMKNLDLKATFSVVNSRAKELGPTYTGYLLKDDRLMMVARYLAGATANYSFISKGKRKGGLTLNMNYMSGLKSYDYLAYYIARYGTTPPITPTPVVDNFIMVYPNVTKFNLSGDWQLTKSFGFTLQVRNLFNNLRYEGNNYYPIQGRSWLMGVTYQL